MYKNLKFLGLIPARGGSKGIPHKNIIPIAGKPLIQHSIDAALGSTYLDSIVVSTDSAEIAEIAKNLRARVPFMRPDKLSSDCAKTIDVVLHAISTLKGFGESYDAVVLLQPTQPLRSSSHIDKSIELFLESGCESVVGVCLVDEHPMLMRTIDKSNKLKPILRQKSTVRRQDFSPVFKVNGAIYINSVHTLYSHTSLNDNIIPFVMDRTLSVDVDCMEDLKVAEKVLTTDVRNS